MSASVDFLHPSYGRPCVIGDLPGLLGWVKSGGGHGYGYHTSGGKRPLASLYVSLKELSLLSRLALDEVPLFLARGAHVPSGCGGNTYSWLDAHFWGEVVVPYMSLRLELGI